MSYRSYFSGGCNRDWANFFSGGSDPVPSNQEPDPQAWTLLLAPTFISTERNDQGCEMEEIYHFE